MRSRIPGLVLAGAFAAALLAPMTGLAQNTPQNTPQNNKGWMDPPSPSSRPPRNDRLQNLDFLFGALKVAPDSDSAKMIADRIWGVWLGSGGDTTNLLIGRVRTAIEGKDLDLAIQLLDSVVQFKPDYVEGWNQRATVYYLKKDYTRSLADLAQVLAREPRHFGALYGVGIIMQEFGDERRALEVFRRALDLDPHMKNVPELVKQLSEKVEGRDI